MFVGCVFNLRASVVTDEWVGGAKITSYLR